MSQEVAIAHHGPPTSFLRKHVFSVDHKVIGKQYFALAMVAVFTGMFLSWLMRFHLVWPNVAIPGLQYLSKVGAPGGVMTPEYYLSLLTMHGSDKRATAFAKYICIGRNQKALVHGGPEAYNS